MRYVAIGHIPDRLAQILSVVLDDRSTIITRPARSAAKGMWRIELPLWAEETGTYNRERGKTYKETESWTVYYVAVMCLIVIICLHALISNIGTHGAANFRS